MELFTPSVDLARIVFIIGAVLAMLYKKKLGITPGGIVVPAFLALMLDQSYIWFGSILIISLLTRLVYRYTLEPRALPRQWQVFANISISAVLVLLAQFLFLKRLPLVEAAAFGFVIPGLIGVNSVRYGTVKVLGGALAVTALTYAIGWALAMAVPSGIATALTAQLGAFEPLELGNPFIYLPAGLLVTGLTMWRFGARTGGYLLAPFLGLLASQSWLQFVAFIAGVGVSYGILQLVLRYSLIVGLERFLVALLLAACMVTLTDLAAVRLALEHYFATSMVLMVAMGVIVNDLCLRRNKLPTLRNITLPVALAYGLRMVVR